MNAGTRGYGADTVVYQLAILGINSVMRSNDL